MIFGVGLLAYFAGKIIVPKLNELSASNQLPALQFPSFGPAPAPTTTTTAPQTTAAPSQQSSPILIPTTSEMTSPDVVNTQFTFNIVGDVDDNALAAATANNLCGGTTPPTLAIIVGDFAYHCDAQKWWTGSMKACNGKSVMGSVGNHDCSGKGYLELFPVNAGKWTTIKKIGNIAFVSLNTGYCSAQCSNPNTEEPTVKQAQDDPNVKFIVVHFHKPIFTANTAPDTPASFHTMLMKYPKVKMVFAGHNHTYKRYTIQGGIQYITVGAGGHDKSSSTPVTKGPSSGTVGVAKCRVAADGSITCQYVANNGEICDQWGLTAEGKHTGSAGVTPSTGPKSAEAAFAQTSFYSHLNPINYPTKEERDNAYLEMMDRRIPQRKFNNTIYHYSTRVMRRRR
jgi:hypothetical protein